MRLAKPKIRRFIFFSSRNFARAELSAWLVCSPTVSSPLRAKAAPGSLERSGAGSSLSLCSLSLGTPSLPGFSSPLVRARNLPLAPELPRQKSPEL